MVFNPLSEKGTPQQGVPHFFGYQTVFFPCQNNPKDLDQSHNMDLDLWDCFKEGLKLV